MEDILSNRDQRYLKILETLFNTQTTTIAHLAKITKSTSRTIQADLQALNLLIKPLSIETSYTLGCSLFCPKGFSIDYIYQIILNNSIEFAVLELLFFEKFAKLEDCASYLYISLSTIKRIVKDLKRVLKPYNIQISTAPAQLLGDEKAVCSYFIHYFAEAYPPNKLPFSKIQTEALNKIIDSALIKNKQFLNFPDLKLLRICLLTSLTRIQNGHFDPTVLIVPKDFDISPIDNFFTKRAFKAIFKIDLTKEILFHLFFPFVSERFIKNYDQLCSLQEKHADVKNTVSEIKFFLSNLQTDLNIPLTNEENILIELFNVINLGSARNYVLHNKKKNFTNNFLKNAPYLTNCLEQIFVKAAQFTPRVYPIDLDEIAYMLITHWEGFAEKLLSLKPTYKVGVFMDSDLEHAAFIATTLNLQFKNELSFEVMTASSIQGALKESGQFDFCITNLSNIKIGNSNFICIELYPSAKDIWLISETYSELAS